MVLGLSIIVVGQAAGDDVGSAAASDANVDRFSRYPRRLAFLPEPESHPPERPTPQVLHPLLQRVMGLSSGDLDELTRELNQIPLDSSWDTPVRRHQHSKSVLQDAFVRMHRFMYEAGYLPLSEWGKGRGSNGRRGGDQDRTVVARLGLQRFFGNFSSLVRHNARCITWDSTHYLELIRPQCTDKWVFRFKQGVAPRAQVDETTKTISGDLPKLTSFPEALGSVSGTFDLIICNQVFEHIPDPWAAARSLFGWLRQGGLLMWTAPFMERYHKVPADYFRYTPEGALEIFQRAGFVPVAARKLGDSLVTSGYAMGFGIGDFDPAYLHKHLVTRFRDDTAWNAREYLYMETALVLRRP